MKEAKTRTIYNNYDLYEDYAESAKESLIDNGTEAEDITENNLWEEIYFLDSINWEDEKEQLENFFNDGNTWILQGFTGRWDGTYKGGYIFTDFMEMFYKATKDCDYIHIYDENGHFYIQCSHHDGTNLYEVKKVTQNGTYYLERWEDNWEDKRTEEYIHDQIMKKYSVLPHYMHNVYGCRKTEYKEIVA